MESLTTDSGSGTSTVVVPSANPHGENGLLSTVILASLLGGNRGWGNNSTFGGDTTSGAAFAYAQRAADNSSQLLTTVTKAEGDIKEAFNAGLHRNQIETAAHFTNLYNRLCDSEKESIKSGYEARLESLQTKADLLAKMNDNTISIKDDIKDFRFSTDKQFCELDHRLERNFNHVEKVIDKKFDSLLEREYKQEINALRDKLDSVRYRETSQDLTEIRKDVDRLLCGMRNLLPTNPGTVNALTGCC